MTAAETQVQPASSGRFPAFRAIGVAIAGVALGLFIAGGVLLIFMTQFLDYHLVTIQSESMEPTLKKGDLVFTRPVSMSAVDEDDIILFNEANTGVPFVHRVRTIAEFEQVLTDGETGEELDRRSTFEFSTRGDANSVTDSTAVTQENFRGRMVLSVPTGSWLGEDTSLQRLMTMLAIGLGVLWIIWEVGSRVVKRRQDAAAQDMTIGGDSQ